MFVKTIHPLTDASRSGETIRQIDGLFFAMHYQRSRRNTLRTTKKIYAITWSSFAALAIIK